MYKTCSIRAKFNDCDSLPKHGEKPQGWKASGHRIERGLYKSRDGFIINADCNGSANIMRKVATQLGLNLAKVGRASLTVPQRIDLFTRLNKSYRKRCASEAGRSPVRLIAYKSNISLESPDFQSGEMSTSVILYHL